MRQPPYPSVLASVLAAALAAPAAADTRASEAKYKAEEAALILDHSRKLLAAKRALVQDLEKDREAAMKAGNLKEANAAEEAIQKARQEIRRGPAAAPAERGAEGDKASPPARGAFAVAGAAER